jgi:integrase
MRTRMPSRMPDPTRIAYVKGALKALTRGRPQSQPMQALRWDSIVVALKKLNSGSLTWDLRAKALLAVAYSTMARRGELVGLTVERIKIDEAGEGIALIYMGKVDREEPRFLSADIVTHLLAWLKHARITSGPVFLRIENTGLAIARCIRRRAPGSCSAQLHA